MELDRPKYGNGTKKTPVALIVSQRYPQGTKDCSDNDGLAPSQSLRSTFPRLDLGTMHYFCYGGCFLEQHDTGRFPTHLNASSNNRLKEGVEAGPLLFFNTGALAAAGKITLTYNLHFPL
jgi:hypothetical protein